MNNSVASAWLFMFFVVSHFSFSQEKMDTLLIDKIDDKILELMEEGDIPGLSAVMIKGDQQIIKSYGYSNLAKKDLVTSNTLFELGSCSKAFTALAVVNLEREGKLILDAPVSHYIPWFRPSYKDSVVEVTIRQLLHHTSGIPWSTISKIPQTNAGDALEQTVRQLDGQELNNLPGQKYEYATINYDVLAFIIQKVTNQSFETYVQQEVINKLQLKNTTIGYPLDSALKATGYKIGFFSARVYEAPVFSGNNAAGYVMSNAVDVSKWLNFQMGLVNSDLYDLIKSTQQRDETVPLHGMSAYAMGWEVSLNGSGEIYHDGLNPNYTAYISFRPGHKTGVAILANSNSSFTSAIGSKVMKLLMGEALKKEYDPGDKNDMFFSIISLIVSCYILVVISFLVIIVVGISGGVRCYERFSFAKLNKLLLVLLPLFPLLYGIYLLPRAMYDFTWEAIFVWTPVSFTILLELIIAALAVSYFAYLVGLFFPEKNKFKRVVPQLLLLSILSGLANIVLIILLTSALDSNIELKYLVFYYFLALSFYLFGRWFVQVNLIKFTTGMIYELRVKLIDKILSTSYQKFEKMDRGRVYTTMNDDVTTIGDSAGMFVMLSTNFFTAIGAFLYLASIAFWASALTILLIVTLTALYFLVSRSTNKYYEQARDTRNVFMRLINGAIDGFKEISLHRIKKQEYKEDVANCADEYRSKVSVAGIRFINASLVGETVLIAILGTVTFAFPSLFPGIKPYTLMSFVIVLLYLIGPVNSILNSVPAAMRLKISWNRIQQFLKDIPANLFLKDIPALKVTKVENIRAKGITYKYMDKDRDVFIVGPIDLEVMSGEILFIIGGNGSGKTTLAKLLTGLYEPDQGELLIDNEPVEPSRLGEYFSSVFSPPYLFKKLYNVDVNNKLEKIKYHLKVLDLEEKVTITGNSYNTIALSGGQRKRLALLQCYLEDSPIYLFDEWAADQDPDYRNFFYRTLLPDMKAMGKIVIAITHDDHYFDVADKVIKLNQGQIEIYSGNSLVSAENLAVR